MLEKEKAIDAVLIATPDHLHAYVSIIAMKAGKHVYCEKPLTHDISEARTVARVARETGVATQMGNQGRSSEGHRQTAEWIWDGAIGQVREVQAWGGAGGLRQGTRAPGGRSGRAAGPQLGPVAGAPRVPSVPPGLCAVRLARVLGLRGRGAAGSRDPPPRPGVQRALARHPGDRGSHGLRRRRTRRSARRGMLVTWRFAARGNTAPVTVQWYDGGLRPPTPRGDRSRRPQAAPGRGEERRHLRRREGDHHLRGVVGHAPPAAARAAPRVQAPREDPPAGGGPPRRLAPGVQGRQAGEQQLRVRRAATASSSCSATWRMRAKKLITWDGPNMKVANAPEADQYLRSTYRAGWELPV